MGEINMEMLNIYEDRAICLLLCIHQDTKF